MNLLSDPLREGIHFPGSNSLGGCYKTTSEARTFFERMVAMFPNLHLDLQCITIRGWPWHTTVIVEWTDHATATDGEPYVNDGVEVIHIRWGKLTGMRIYLDTAKVDEVERRLARKGIGTVAR